MVLNGFARVLSQHEAASHRLATEEQREALKGHGLQQLGPSRDSSDLPSHFVKVCQAASFPTDRRKGPARVLHVCCTSGKRTASSAARNSLVTSAWPKSQRPKMSHHRGSSPMAKVKR